MEHKKQIALVAHDTQKKDLVEWVRKNANKLSKHELICTGTTGKLILEMFEHELPDVKISMRLLKSGPLGGDQQMGAMICDGKIDFLVFLTDPMTPQPHDVDVKALIRVAVIYNIIMACNLTTAEFVINSPLFNSEFKPVVRDFTDYMKRTV
ncbi:MAG: methylglyoxal synthase [Deferribacteraceae bacterium]|jgi:methylglyoxal synthase|nr:methylglyoxal synthase [Deferribacteraceae bacterium]